ncbi:MAG: hypothetical protein JNM14_06145 [Ferruginibacter sp.]|nr:hypothetical protein [Ferruginibacter sp.]
MKTLKLVPAFILSLFVLQAKAQTNGKITLADNTVLTGLVKDNIRKDASVVLIADGKEKKYHGADITSATVGETDYTCIKGDFFKVVCNGELTFLQKASDASSKPTTVGNEVFFLSGTEGKPGDYFIYETKNQQLKLVSKKTLNTVVASSFGTYAPAIEKAKAAQTDIAQLKIAVETYNSRNEK